jgi:hypothetical protein
MYRKALETGSLISVFVSRKVGHREVVSLYLCERSDGTWDVRSFFGDTEDNVEVVFGDVHLSPFGLRWRSW